MTIDKIATRMNAAGPLAGISKFGKERISESTHVLDMGGFPVYLKLSETKNGYPQIAAWAINQWLTLGLRLVVLDDSVLTTTLGRSGPDFGFFPVGAFQIAGFEVREKKQDGTTATYTSNVNMNLRALGEAIVAGIGTATEIDHAALGINFVSDEAAKAAREARYASGSATVVGSGTAIPEREQPNDKATAKAAAKAAAKAKRAEARKEAIEIEDIEVDMTYDPWK